MAALEVIALDTSVPQLMAPQAGDTYTFPRAVEMPLGTANGVLYLNGSKVVTSGSALTFDGSVFKVAKAGGVFGPTNLVYVDVTSSFGGVTLNSASGQNCFFELYQGGTTKVGEFGVDAANSLVNIGGFGSYNTRFYAAGSEQMRLTSTGLGIGTNNPASKLYVAATSADYFTPQIILGEAPTSTSKNLWIGYNTTANKGYIQAVHNNTEYTDLVLQPNGGNLGIGTSSPSQKLTVSVADAAQSASFQAATGRIRFRPYVDATNGAIIDVTNTAESAYIPLSLTGSVVRLFAGANSLLLDASGNLGLGVTPSTWNAGKAIEFGGIGNHLWGVSGNSLYLGSNAYYDSGFKYVATGAAATYQSTVGEHRWYTAPSGTAGNAISFTQALTLDANRNLLLNGTSAGASAVGTLAIFNGTAPTGSVTDGIILYAEDVSSSSELKVRDEAGNVTTLSPHNFSLIPEGPSEDMAWAYYSEKDGKRINVDMLKLARMVEKLTGEKLVYSA